MRSIFIGTVDLSWQCLRELVNLGEEISAIFTMPSERAGNISAYKPFQDLAARSGCPLYETANINSDEVLDKIRSLKPEIVYVIGWPRLVKRPLIALPTKGCFGMHTSLLPKYRGGAPVNWGIINGETLWGITLMYLGEGVDDGDIVAQAEFPITIEDTCKTVYDKAALGALRLIRENVPLINAGCAPRRQQNEAEATFFRQRKPEQGLIDWNKGAMAHYNWIRALTHPYPGAFTYAPDGRRIFLWSAEVPSQAPSPAAYLPGAILSLIPGRGMAVSTNDYPVIITRMQPEGEAENSAEYWAGALGLTEGTSFASPRPR